MNFPIVCEGDIYGINFAGVGVGDIYDINFL